MPIFVRFTVLDVKFRYRKPLLKIKAYEKLENVGKQRSFLLDKIKNYPTMYKTWIRLFRPIQEKSEWPEKSDHVL